MQVQKGIEKKLQEVFHPEHLEVDNESHQHNVPENSETHFRVLIVSQAFEGLSRIQRQKKVYETLKEELAGPVHALTQRVLTPLEWQEQNHEGFQSPACRGGGKTS